MGRGQRKSAEHKQLIKILYDANAALRELTRLRDVEEERTKKTVEHPILEAPDKLLERMIDLRDEINRLFAIRENGESR